MNKETTSTSYPENSDQESSDFWHLNNEPQYPRNPEDWKIYNWTEEPPAEPNRYGRHDYALIVNPQAQRPQLEIARTLFREFRTDFDAIQGKLSPESWRLLYYLDGYDFHALGSPRCDLRRRLAESSRRNEDVAEIPSEWLGTGKANSALAEHAFAELAYSDISDDEAKAVYTTLAIAHALWPTQCDILKIAWWEPEWLEAMFASLPPTLPQPRQISQSLIEFIKGESETEEENKDDRPF